MTDEITRVHQRIDQTEARINTIETQYRDKLEPITHGLQAVEFELKNLANQVNKITIPCNELNSHLQKHDRETEDQKKRQEKKGMVWYAAVVRWIISTAASLGIALWILIKSGILHK